MACCPLLFPGSDPHSEDKKAEEAGDGDDDCRTGENPSLTNSKSSKRRKAKKEKSFKERDGEVVPTPDSEQKEEDPVEEIGEPLDPKEVLKRMQSLKKKKSSSTGETTAAKAAAAEAAARAAKLAAAKKKEKSHYNQQPVR